MVSLGLGLPSDFANPLIAAAGNEPATSDAEASYQAAIAMTEDSDIVPQAHNDDPDDMRPAIYRAAIADLDRLLGSPPTGWPESARTAAERIRENLRKYLDLVPPQPAPG